jgi:predicted O-linked N-acetylglucosamine transferase (SPINDLY family)
LIALEGSWNGHTAWQLVIIRETAALMAELSIQRAFDSALQHHRAGRLHEAEQLYRLILAQRPEHIDAMQNLGLIAQQAGRIDVAVDLLRRVIALGPNNAEAYSNLGNALKDRGQLDEAIAACRQAIALRPNMPEAHNNLGIALADKGQLDEAIATYRQAIALRPNFPEAHNNLGGVLMDKGQLDEAIAAFRQAIALRPNYPEAHSNLGNALKNKGQLDEAIAACRRAIALNPNLPEAHSNLGIVLRDIALRDKGQLDEAIAACRRAIALRPHYSEAHNNLGGVLMDKGQLDEAIAAFRQAIALRPNYAQAHYNLGNALRDKGQLDEAVTACRQATSIRPNFAEAHNNLGNALKDKGRLDEAINCIRQAVRLKPDFAEAHSNLVYMLPFNPAYDARMILEENRRWDQQHAEPLKKHIRPHSNDRNPDRRLRIGYVSPDFREHCQALFTIPLLSNHDREAFEVFCYADVGRPDAVTERIGGYAQVLRSIVGMTDAEAARKIREDRIDILVDLTMHMGNNRLAVFAVKPAPVQAAWLAYPGTTGLSAMDYRFTDPYLDPPGLNDQFYSEKSIRLPDSFWCYDPLVSDLAVNALPAQTLGHVTFGCLNNFCKVNEPVLRLWAQVLKTVDRSRLMMLCPEGSHRQPLLELLQREGISPDRIELLARRPRLQYLDLFHRIDLGLDTFPYNGHTTSLDSFWMGVPVVTLVGQTVVGRAGLSQLTNLGLRELIARTPEQYIQIAADMARDLTRLAELRRTLRGRMEASPLMDAPRFARNIEAAYRQMWRNWCATGEDSSLQSPPP